MDRMPIGNYMWMQMHSRVPTRMSTATVASRAGVHRDTLLRWLREGIVPEPSRDRRGWRVFTEQDAQRIVAHATAASPPRSNQISVATRGESIRRLEAIDWQFADAKTDYLTHGLHPYPAKYIPQIPNALIQELSTTGERVGDIFCGSGTTLVEALLLKRDAFGIDANPLACMISRAKTSLLSFSDLSSVRELVKRADDLGNELATYQSDSLFGTKRFQSTATRPDVDDLTFWFDNYVVEELAEARSWCRELPSEAARTLALVSLSAIIVGVSKQDSDTRYVRRVKPIQPGDTLRKFARSLRNGARMVAELNDLIEPRFSCQIIDADLLTSPVAPPLDLVVCSPPYPNAYSYHLYHRTRMLWLGLDQVSFKRAEIGSHRKYSAKGRSAATIETFRDEMMTILRWLRGILRRDRHVCFVVGNSTIAGKSHDNAALITDVAMNLGYIEEARLSRRMLDTKKAFNPAIGKIKKEELVILRNAEGDTR